MDRIIIASIEELAVKVMVAPPATFELFSKLPREIQDEIFRLAVGDVEATHITLRGRKKIEGGRKINGQVYSYTKAWTPLDKVPALLHVCKRSRIQALKRWTLSFDKSDESGGGMWKAKKRVYIDHKTDTLFFNHQLPDMLPFNRFVHGVNLSSLQQITTVTFNLNGLIFDFRGCYHRDLYERGVLLGDMICEHLPNLRLLKLYRKVIRGLPRPSLSGRTMVDWFYGNYRGSMTLLEANEQLLARGIYESFLANLNLTA